MSLLAAGLFLAVFGFYFASICVKPGTWFYLLGKPSGQGAALAIACSMIYGFIAQREDTARSK